MILQIIKKINIFPLIIIIKIYQWFISPILQTNCRYLPSCSEYSIEALKEHGLMKGLYFSIKRILHCHPYGGAGYDPIPKKIKKEI